ncbi:MAG: TrkH family potassium uptake protein [Phaeovulum sp.]|uniref:TrkH family potassium uptake protein n=1 Tax=Phaeovulum sp. TaxID=2934796 RepID=UPI00272F2E35|nr:TrkH family potassium uptake protein [Phaeovulum sp.]MDP2062290.1 TrkH family potassium uptake protein [Phaeovulum sp.]
MIDLRPVAHIIGLLVTVLGLLMLIPMALDWQRGDANWLAFLEAAIITTGAGGLVALATHSAIARGLNLHDSFLLTSGAWLVLPAFGTLPFLIGAPDVSFTDAYFEAMSGVTTTGTTAFPALDRLPWGTNLWRAILQWLGGLGIVIVALIFLPVMKIGGMQYFRSEGFDTLGKILPRAIDISTAMLRIYIGLTVLCAMVYAAAGMTAFDAIIHALTTLSTGGFSNYDASFGAYKGAPEVVATVFMILASLPFIRFVQLSQGQMRPFWRDVQVRAYLRWIGYAVVVIVVYRMVRHEAAFWPTLREVTFNVAATFSGTGYLSEDVTKWGHLAFVVLLVIGLIGGCTSSTACSVKVFRYLILFEAIKTQIKRLHSPHRVLAVHYDGRPVEAEVVSSVIAFFSLFILSYGVLIVGLSLTGLTAETAMTAAWTAIANVGPAWGPEVSGNGAIDQFPTASKWLMIAGMYVGRLELMAVYVLLLPRFWRG